MVNIQRWINDTQRSFYLFILSYSVETLSCVRFLRPHGLQHTRLPCPSLPLCSNSKTTDSLMPSNHLLLCQPILILPSISVSIKVFSNESVFPIWWPKYWSFSFSISPSVDIQGWFPLGLTGLIFLLSKGFLRVFSNITVWKYQFFSLWNSIVVESKGN